MGASKKKKIVKVGENGRSTYGGLLTVNMGTHPPSTRITTNPPKVEEQGTVFEIQSGEINPRTNRHVWDWLLATEWGQNLRTNEQLPRTGEAAAYFFLFSPFLSLTLSTIMTSLD